MVKCCYYFIISYGISAAEAQIKKLFIIQGYHSEIVKYQKEVLKYYIFCIKYEMMSTGTGNTMVLKISIIIGPDRSYLPVLLS